MTCGEALGNAAGGSHGSGDLLGGQPGDAHEQHNQAHATSGEQAAHEGERGFFVVQGHDQVKLQSGNVAFGGRANDECFVAGAVHAVDGGELVGNLVLRDEVSQGFGNAVPLWRGGDGAVVVVDQDDWFKHGSAVLPR